MHLFPALSALRLLCRFTSLFLCNVTLPLVFSASSSGYKQKAAVRKEVAKAKDVHFSLLELYVNSDRH